MDDTFTRGPLTETEGYGFGYGDGFGGGCGCGYGYGYGDGCGYGFGYGNGNGYGHGDGFGFGYGGYGRGFGFGDGYGDGYGVKIGETKRHPILHLAPWPYVKVGCRCMSIEAWRSQWREVAKREGVEISKRDAEALLRKAEGLVDG